MSWECPPWIKSDCKSVNDELELLKGELSDDEAKIALIKYLRGNLGLAMGFLTGGSVKLESIQEVIIRNMFNADFSMYIASRGGGKTVSVNNHTFLIDKNKGFITTKDVFPEKPKYAEEYEQEIDELNLWNGHSWQPTSKLLVQAEKDCAKITTSRGYCLEGSLNHKIKVLDKEKCEIVWKRYRELGAGDYICISRNEVDWEAEEINDDEAYLVGLFLGDGYIGRSNYTIITDDRETVDFCKKFDYTNVDNTKGKTVKVVRFRKIFCDYLKDKYDFKGELSYTKKIPKRILRSKRAAKHCLSALFDTDGMVSSDRNIVGFCSTSKELASQVHNLLLTFGIISSKREEKTKTKFGKAWQIRISGEETIKFFERIGFRLTRKQLRYFEIKKTKFNTNVNVVPGAMEKIAAFKLEKSENRIYADNRKFYYTSSSNKSIGYTRFRESLDYLEKNNVEITDNLLEIERENYYFDPIKSIEFTKKDCIDFCDIPNGSCYWSNGFISHNSFLAAVFCILYSVFNPNTKIILAGPTFRTSRNIFDAMTDIIHKKESVLLRQCFVEKYRSKRPDMYEWKVNGGSIRAIPLSGEKIRGFRANVLICDEFLLLSEEIVDVVLKPFLVAGDDINQKQRIIEEEDELVAKGKMSNEDRTNFDSNSKFIVLSSASYSFENLYKTYCDWSEKIFVQEAYDKSNSNYFIAQLGWQAFPKHMLNEDIVHEAEGGSASSDAIKREYYAQFVDGSDSYFSAEKMAELTMKGGHDPCVRIVGKPDKKYILGMDPSWSNSPASDHFAMSVLEIGDNLDDITLVHSYAVAGGSLKDHVKYLHFILEHFNICMLVIDNAGWEFIDSANNSPLFAESQIDLKFILIDPTKEGPDYVEQMKNFKKEYKPEHYVFCVKQVFHAEFIRKGNQELQTSIDRKKIFFASGLKEVGNESQFSKSLQLLQNMDDRSFIPYEIRKNSNEMEAIGHYIDFQDDMIQLTKKECALVEVSSTAKGTQTFDLPRNLRSSNSPNKARKDNYTSLMLANWGAKILKDAEEQEVSNVNKTFRPFRAGGRMGIPGAGRSGGLRYGI